jgi:hypothetical protein
MARMDLESRNLVGCGRPKSRRKAVPAFGVGIRQAELLRILAKAGTALLRALGLWIPIRCGPLPVP